MTELPCSRKARPRTYNDITRCCVAVRGCSPKADITVTMEIVQTHATASAITVTAMDESNELNQRPFANLGGQSTERGVIQPQQKAFVE